MGGLEMLSPTKFQVQAADQKPPQSRTPSKYMETSSSRATFIRQLVRTMSLEDILADEEVCDILSDSPEPEDEDDDYEEPLKANILQQHVNKLIEDDTLSKKASAAASFNYFNNGSRHVLTASPTHCYTVDMATGVASPIKITSNVDKKSLYSFASTRSTGQVSSSLSYFSHTCHQLLKTLILLNYVQIVMRAFIRTNSTANAQLLQVDVVPPTKRFSKETDPKVEFSKRQTPAHLSQGIKNLHFEDESPDDRGSSNDEREGLDEKDLLYQSVYPVGSPNEDEVPLHNGLLSLQPNDLGVRIDLREPFK